MDGMLLSVDGKRSQKDEYIVLPAVYTWILGESDVISIDVRLYSVYHNYM